MSLTIRDVPVLVCVTLLESARRVRGSARRDIHREVYTHHFTSNLEVIFRVVDVCKYGISVFATSKERGDEQAPQESGQQMS